MKQWQSLPHTNRLIRFLAISAFFASCGEQNESIVDRATTVSPALPAEVVVTGSLNLSADPSPAGTGLGEREVLLQDSNGNTIQTAQTTAAGTFVLNVTPTDLGLTAGYNLNAGGTVTMARMAKIQSLFLTNDGSADQAVGMRNTLILGGDSVTYDDTGAATINTGSHTIKQVGAITGSVSLETGESPRGIMVYVPGTTHIAITDEQGSFLLGFLPPGTYKLVAEKDGFNDLEWGRVTVKRNKTTTLTGGVMGISVGPSIPSLSLGAMDEATGLATVQADIRSASRYRVSLLSNFSDAGWEAVDAANPVFSIPMNLPVGVRYITVYLEAADSDGLSASRSLIIDMEAPSLGSISITTNQGAVSAQQLALTIAATGASKMKVLENMAAIDSTSWVDYATSANYTLTDSTNGERKLYIVFADEAGNVYGTAGEVSAIFTFDNVAPENGRIFLLPPESPTGAFKTPLAWESTFDVSTESVSFEIQVSKQKDFSSILRTMTTSKESIKISPALVDEGQYYWRVRGTDQAGNSSDWVVASDLDKTDFELGILATSFQSSYEWEGAAGEDESYGKNIMKVGDLNGDGISEIAVSSSNGSVETSQIECSECARVDIVNTQSEEDEPLMTLSAGMSRYSGYGKSMALCDLDGDSVDELLVAAPYQAHEDSNEVIYHNTGVIVSHSLATGAELARYAPEPLKFMGMTTGWYQCSTWNANNTSCLEYGWENWPSSIDYEPYADGGLFVGWNISCLRKSGAADHLIATAPGWAPSGSFTSRGALMELSQTTNSGNPSIGLVRVIDTGNRKNEGYGSGLAVFNNLRYTDGSATCSGNVIAVGVSALYQPSTTDEKGGARLYQPDAVAGDGSWELCGTINATADDDSWQYYGSGLFNLGDIDKDGTYEELAVATNGWGGGVIRIFGGTGGTQLKSLKISSNDAYGLMGYFVGPAGDMDGAGNQMSELAIGAPSARINGYWGAGAVYIYQWDQIDDDDDDNDGDADSAIPYLTIKGRISQGSYLGSAYLPFLANESDIHSAASSGLISAPGTQREQTWDVGSVHSFSELRMAPGAPTLISGESSNALLGSGLAVPGDVDQDGTADFLMAQPGGRCDGRYTGMVSLYSGQDGLITKNFCGSYNESMTGQYLGMIGNYVTFNHSSEYYLMSTWDFLSYKDKDAFYEAKNTGSVNKPWQYASARYSGGTMQAGGSDGLASGTTFSSVKTYDDDNWILFGEPQTWNSANYVGKIKLSKPGYAWYQRCYIHGQAEDEYFGTGVELLDDIDGDAQLDLAVGSIGKSAGDSGHADDPGDSDGMVQLFSFDFDNCTANMSGNATEFSYNSMSELVRIAANHSDILDELGRPASEGFGARVISLGDLDGNPGAPLAGTDGSGVAFLAIANSNYQVGYKSDDAELFVFRINADYSADLLWYQVADGQTGLGGLMRVLEDINGDSVPELAVSEPGGTGRFGPTGHVAILSGAALAKSADDEVLLQMLFNPHNQVSDFGHSFEHADFDGDGLMDFVVGAPDFNTNQYQKAGAVYIFPMEPL